MTTPILNKYQSPSARKLLVGSSILLFAAGCASGSSPDDPSPNDPANGSSEPGLVDGTRNPTTEGPGAETPDGSGGGAPVDGTGGSAPVNGTGGVDGSGGGGVTLPPIPENCEYPSGPYAEVDTKGGVYVGRPLPPDTGWTGYDVNGNYGPISIQDLQDCDGSRGINAIILKSTYQSCGVCRAYLKNWTSRLASEKVGPGKPNDWYGRGVFAFAALAHYQNEEGRWFTDEEGLAQGVHLYFDQYTNDIEPLGVAPGWGIIAEPNDLIYNTGVGVIPIHMLIDPRSMLVVSTAQDRYSALPDPGEPSGPRGFDELMARNER